jgi:hypothetical protein
VAKKEMQISFNSKWFYYSMILCGVAIVVGIIMKSISSLKLLSIEELHEKWLGLEEWRFKCDIIYWAGYAFKRNIRHVNLKGYFATSMMVLFLLELICLMKWLISF